MREKLNSNPLYQAVVIGVPLFGGGSVVLTTMGGGEVEGNSSSTAFADTIEASAESGPAASLQDGYHSPESVEQAVVDARYKGRTLGYHP
jgi:hypothetical protein